MAPLRLPCLRQLRPMPNSPTDPRKALRTAVDGLRALGTVFIAEFGLYAFVTNMAGPGRLRLRINNLFLLTPSTLILLTPAVLYQIAAFSIQRREMWAAALAMRTVVYQCLLVVGGAIWVFGTISVRAPLVGILRGPVLVPIIMAMFFVPALCAQLFALRKAIRAIHLLPQSQRGFEPIPLPYPTPQEPSPNNQPSDNDLGK
jgi:hypothetical protein